MEKVLLTSAGGLVGTYLTKHLKRAGNYYLVGTDMSANVPLKEKLDAFYLTSPSKGKNYLNEIEEIIQKEKIDIIIPVSSYDMEVYSHEEVKQRLQPTKWLTMDYTTHSCLHDKKTGKQFLEELGIKTPETYESQKEVLFPSILKVNKSSGSRNVVLLEKWEDYAYWKEKIKDFTIFEYLVGKEYTVDCLFDGEGKCNGYNVRERVKTNGGGAVISTCVIEERLEEVIRKLENCGKIKGPVNFQYKLKDGEICIFDFNTRLASGGLPLSVEAGFDIPQRLIHLLEGKKEAPWQLKKEQVGLTMFRYYEESYIGQQKR